MSKKGTQKKREQRIPKLGQNLIQKPINQNHGAPLAPGE